MNAQNVCNLLETSNSLSLKLVMQIGFFLFEEHITNVKYAAYKGGDQVASVSAIGAKTLCFNFYFFC